MPNSPEYMKQYQKNHLEAHRLADKKYYKNNKKKCKKRLKQWRKKNLEKYEQQQQKYKEKSSILHKQHYQENREKIILQIAQYRQTEKGKLVQQKAVKKSNAKRKRNLGWIKLFENPFGDSEKVDWHHITDAYVVALPEDLHELYGGKQHREMMITIVKQIYGG